MKMLKPQSLQVTYSIFNLISQTQIIVGIKILNFSTYYPFLYYSSHYNCILTAYLCPRYYTAASVSHSSAFKSEVL